MNLPATPSIARIARAFLGFDPWRFPNQKWYSGMSNLLPLDVPAGLEIARQRLEEVRPNTLPGWPAETVHERLLAHDPELKGASDE